MPWAYPPNSTWLKLSIRKQIGRPVWFFFWLLLNNTSKKWLSFCPLFLFSKKSGLFFARSGSMIFTRALGTPSARFRMGRTSRWSDIAVVRHCGGPTSWWSDIALCSHTGGHALWWPHNTHNQPHHHSKSVIMHNPGISRKNDIPCQSTSASSTSVKKKDRRGSLGGKWSAYPPRPNI